MRLSVLGDANMEPARPRACATAHPDTAESDARTRAARRASGDPAAPIPAPAYQVRGLIKYSRADSRATDAHPGPCLPVTYQFPLTKRFLNFKVLQISFKVKVIPGRGIRCFTAQSIFHGDGVPKT